MLCGLQYAPVFTVCMRVKVEGVDWVFFALLDQMMLVIEEFFSCDGERLKLVTRDFLHV